MPSQVAAAEERVDLDDRQGDSNNPIFPRPLPTGHVHADRRPMEWRERHHLLYSSSTSSCVHSDESWSDPSQIFTYAGVTGSNTSLITSGAYGLVKLVFTLLFTWVLIDRLGRRPCFLTGLFFQCITHIYMAIYMALWRGSGNKSASDAAIASVFVYAVGWSIGLCTIPYLYATEIYPTRIRSVCYAVNMTVHWLFQFAVVRVTPNMFVALDVYGAYVFWAIICAVGLVGLGLWAPETKGVPMERMEELFEGKWYTGWKKSVDLTRAPEGDLALKGVDVMGEPKQMAMEVEKV